MCSSTGYKEKYVGQMVHTKFHGLQTDNHLNWMNRINHISKCACACTLTDVINTYVCTPFSDAT